MLGSVLGAFACIEAGEGESCAPPPDLGFNHNSQRGAMWENVNRAMWPA